MKVNAAGRGRGLRGVMCSGRMHRAVMTRAETADAPPPPPPPPTPAEFMADLPGISAPLGFFDPLNLSGNCKSISSVKLLREAELMHGRVSMMAVRRRSFLSSLVLLCVCV